LETHETKNNTTMKHVLSILTLCILGITAVQAQKVNEVVEIESAGAWYPGKILKAEGDKYFITYDGWSEDFNEWVQTDRLRGFKTAAAPATASPLTKFKVGDKVEVEYGMVPEPATVIEVGESKYHIKYENTLLKDKWVTEREIKKL